MLQTVTEYRISGLLGGVCFLRYLMGSPESTQGYYLGIPETFPPYNVLSKIVRQPLKWIQKLLWWPKDYRLFYQFWFYIPTTLKKKKKSTFPMGYKVKALGVILPSCWLWQLGGLSHQDQQPRRLEFQEYGQCPGRCYPSREENRISFVVALEDQ